MSDVPKVTQPADRSENSVQVFKNVLGGLSRPLWNKNIVQKLSRLEGRGQAICCIWRRVEGGEFSDFFVSEEW